MKIFQYALLPIFGLFPIFSSVALAEVKTTSAGVDFTRSTDKNFGSGWTGPDGITWGTLVREANDEPKYMFRNEASKYCESIGGKLPSQYTYRDFHEFKGEELFSNDLGLGLSGSLDEVQKYVASDGIVVVMGEEFSVDQVPQDWECDEKNKYWTSDEDPGKDITYYGIFNLLTGEFHLEGTDGIQVPRLVRCIKESPSSVETTVEALDKVPVSETLEKKSSVLTSKARKNREIKSQDIVTFSFANHTFTGPRSRIFTLPNGDSVVADPNLGMHFGRIGAYEEEQDYYY